MSCGDPVVKTWRSRTQCVCVCGGGSGGGKEGKGDRETWDPVGGMWDLEPRG